MRATFGGLTTALLAGSLLLSCGKTYEEEAPPARDFTIQAGTQLSVSPTEDFQLEGSEAGAEFTGVLAQELVAADGQLLAPQGAPVEGEVVEVPVQPGEPSTKAGQAKTGDQPTEPSVGVELTALTLNGGEIVEISTAPVVPAEAAADPEATPTVPEERVMQFVLDEPVEVTLQMNVGAPGEM